MSWSHGYFPEFPGAAYDRWKTTDPRDAEYEEEDRDPDEELPSGEFGPGKDENWPKPPPPLCSICRRRHGKETVHACE